jgi:hypothetical protein
MTAARKSKDESGPEDERLLAAVRLIQSWRDAQGEDRDDQAATWEYLKHALNDSRTSNRRRI